MITLLFHLVKSRNNRLDDRHGHLLGGDDRVHGRVLAGAVTGVIGDEVGDLPVRVVGDELVGVGVRVDAKVPRQGCVLRVRSGGGGWRRRQGTEDKRKKKGTHGRLFVSVLSKKRRP